MSFHLFLIFLTGKSLYTIITSVLELPKYIALDVEHLSVKDSDE